jgi:sugar lactone lactonase YvrE
VKRLALLTTVLATLSVGLGSAAQAAPAHEKWDTRVFAHVQQPGYPAYVLAHRNGRVYAGTFENPQGDSQHSRIFEWQRNGTLLRSWRVPHQRLGQAHGVQVANQDRRGRLVVLESSTSTVRTFDPATGRWHRWATLPDLPTCTAGGHPCSPNTEDKPAIPNYATWGPHGALYVSDYGQAVIWKLSRRTQHPKVWFTSSSLDGTEFGTTGLVYRHRRHDLLIGQGSTAADPSVPADGKLYRLPIRRSGRPGTLSTLWTSRPADVPDGIGVARNGHLFIGCAGLSNRIVELKADGTEVDSFPTDPSGSNGSAIPFDTPSNATFVGKRILVANQSFTGDSSHHAILDVYVGVRGQKTFLPRHAFWH